MPRPSLGHASIEHWLSRWQPIIHLLIVRLYRLPLRAQSLNKLLVCCLTIPFGGPCTNLTSAHWHIRLKRCPPKSRDVPDHSNACVMCQRPCFRPCIVCRHVHIGLNSCSLLDGFSGLAVYVPMFRSYAGHVCCRACSRSKSCMHGPTNSCTLVDCAFVSLAVACAFA